MNAHLKQCQLKNICLICEKQCCDQQELEIHTSSHVFKTFQNSTWMEVGPGVYVANAQIIDYLNKWS